LWAPAPAPAPAPASAPAPAPATLPSTMARGCCGDTRRHRRVLRNSLRGITQGDLRRLARRGGVKRITATMYWQARGFLMLFLEDVIRRACHYQDHARRRLLTKMDVIYALKSKGITLYA
jgi:histone H4